MSNEFKPMKYGCGRYVQAPVLLRSYVGKLLCSKVKKR